MMIISLIFTLFILTILSTSIPYIYANDINNTPIYKNGSILWNTSVGTVSLILGDPSSGGWFSFPYLYTCFLNHILVWNFIDGYPKLTYSFPEPGARDVVMYGKYLLVQVKDGINIYEMDTPTSFITYGGIYLPCDNGKLLWGTSNISKDKPVPHIMCPDGKIYGLHKWDFKETENFKSSDHPIPIPPMVWGKVRGIFGDKILVSPNLPLFIDTATSICDTTNYIALKTDKGIKIINKYPPYRTVWENDKAKGALCGNINSIATWEKSEENNKWNVTIWSDGITSSIPLRGTPTSIYGSYDHFIITTNNNLLLVSTIPPVILASTTIPSGSTLFSNGSLLYIKREEKKNIFWLLINNWRLIPSRPHTAVAYITYQISINNDLSLGKPTKTSIVTFREKHKTVIVKNGVMYTLKGIPINKKTPSITININDGSVWWIENKEVKHCQFTPSLLHIKNYLYSMTGKTKILCLGNVETEKGKEGYPLLLVLGVLLIIIIIFKNNRGKGKPHKPNKRIKANRISKRTKRRKVWRYGSS